MKHEIFKGIFFVPQISCIPLLIYFTADDLLILYIYTVVKMYATLLKSIDSVLPV